MMMKKLIVCLKSLLITKDSFNLWASWYCLIVSYENHDEYRLDTIWYHLYQIKSLIGSDYRFRNLFNVARLPFLTLHSNVGIERVYSFVNKNKKEGSDRNKLDIEGLLSAISAVKMDQPESFSNVMTLNPVKNCLRKQRKLLPNASSSS